MCETELAAATKNTGGCPILKRSSFLSIRCRATPVFLHPEQKSQRCDVERSTTIGESPEPFSVDYDGNASSVEKVGKATTNSTGTKTTTSAQKSQGDLVRIKNRGPVSSESPAPMAVDYAGVTSAAEAADQTAMAFR